MPPAGSLSRNSTSRVFLIAALLSLPAAGPLFAQTAEPVRDVRIDQDGDLIPDRLGELVTTEAVLSMRPYLAAGGQMRAYIQDETGGIRLVTNDPALLDGLSAGDRVRVTGTVGQYRATELMEVAQLERLSAGAPPEPRNVLIVEAASEELSGQLVRVVGRVRVASSLMLEDESGSMLLYLRNRYFGDPRLRTELIDGRGVMITGVVEQYDRTPPLSDAYRIVPRDEADLDFAPLAPTALSVVLLSLLAAITVGWLTMWVLQTRRRARAMSLVLATRQALYENQKRFVADAGHEIRTPLTVLRGDIELALLRGRSAGDYESVLRRAISDLDRVSRLADDLLALAAADDLELHIDPDVDLAALLDGVRDRYAARADEAGVTIEVVGDAELTLEADPGLVDRAVSNLVDNALKYGSEGGVVQLDARLVEGCIQITVSDRGPGVPAAARSRLFDRFYRGDTNSVVHGSGLGLSVVQSVMQRHGGRVSVEHPEKGVRFLLTFPSTGIADGRPEDHQKATWRKRTPSLNSSGEPAESSPSAAAK